EQFAEGGGLVFLTGDRTVQIKGAVKLPARPEMPDQEVINRILKAKKYNKLGPDTAKLKHIQGATPLAKALEKELQKARIVPPLGSLEERAISVSVQGVGDIEYLFAVNASSDEMRPKDRLAMKAVETKITVLAPAHGLYNAVTGGLESGFKP